MKITSKTGEELNFLESGVEGIYVLDHVTFKDKFDNDGCNNWDKSSGKKKLQEWAEKNLPDEILKQFDVDIPTADEVFSQKMIDWWSRYSSTDGLVAKQFPIFKNSDNRMMEFCGKPIWWWTRSICVDYTGYLFGVNSDGSINDDHTSYAHGFVPVLRKKARKVKMKKVKDITFGEFVTVCNANNVCCVCPLKNVCEFSLSSLTSAILEDEVEVPEE